MSNTGMERCPVSGKEVTSRPQWIYRHSTGKYSTRVRRIGTDILVLDVVAVKPVILEQFEDNLVARVVEDSGLENRPFFILWDLQLVKGLSYSYKRGIATFLYLYRQPSLRCVVFYNILPEFRHTAECILSIIPSSMTLRFAPDYREAMQLIENCDPGGTISYPEETDQEEYDTLKKNFLGATTRIGWLNMLNEKIPFPPEHHALYPFFSALALLQKDLMEQSTLHEKRKESLLGQYSTEIHNLHMQLSFSEKATKQLLTDFEREKTQLGDILSEKKNDCAQSSTAQARNRSMLLRELCYNVHRLEADSSQKKQALRVCNRLLEIERNEQKIDLPLTATDSAFLTRLQETHPNLNNRELKICLLIKMSYSNEDIAETLGISRRGMESIRYRMHKKIRLQKNQSLKNYLTGLASSAG